MNEMYIACVKAAERIISSNLSNGMSKQEIIDYLYNEEINKLEREKYTDLKLIDFNDEIESIEEIDDMEMIDIGVSGDNLFYANGVLVKNSFGLPQTVDFMFAVTTDEVLRDNNQQMLIPLKTRWGNKNGLKPQLIGVDFDTMTYYDVGTSKEVSSQVGHNKPTVKKKETNRSIEDIQFD